MVNIKRMVGVFQGGYPEAAFRQLRHKGCRQGGLARVLPADNAENRLFHGVSLRCLSRALSRSSGVLMLKNGSSPGAHGKSTMAALWRSHA